jgi:hypothetical protein
VAGKRAEVWQDELVAIDILIPGEYTLESRDLVSVEGADLQPGASLFLPPGTYRLRSQGTTEVITLRLGNNLHRPSSAPPTGVLYYPLERL